MLTNIGNFLVMVQIFWHIGQGAHVKALIRGRAHHFSILGEQSPPGDIVEQEEGMRGHLWDARSSQATTFNAADCVLHSRADLDSASSLGNKLMYHRNFRASRDCFHIALQSWWAGIQQQPQAYLGKAGPSSRQINNAVQKLHVLGVKSGSALSDGLQSKTDAISKDTDNDEGRPQVPPQLLYMHKLKEQNAVSSTDEREAYQGMASRATGSTPPHKVDKKVVAPRAVRERKAVSQVKQKEQNQQVKPSQENLLKIRKGILDSTSLENRRSSPLDDYDGINAEETLKGIEDLSPEQQIKRLRAAAVNPNIRHSSTSHTVGPYGR